MKYANLDEHTYAMRLDPGEDIHAEIQQFCAEQHIDNASISGIGSVERLTLAHYSIQTKQFTDKALEGIFEVTSLVGNVALVDGSPFAHLHVTAAGPDMQSFGGHLVKGECSATLELVIAGYPSHHQKHENADVGLKVWDFDR
jgi:predicted DNA-binding protein with PD1-like motif